MKVLIQSKLLAILAIFSAFMWAIISLGCKKANVEVGENAPAVISEELLRTSQSWDGAELPDYLQGRPELVTIHYEIPPGQKLGWHHHPVMNYGVIVQGELTVIDLNGNKKIIHEGEAVVETVNTIHHGENNGTKTAILYVFYLSQEGLPLAVQHPDIPLE